VSVHQGAMASALSAAGFKDSRDRLSTLAIDAWAKFGDSPAGRRAFIRNALSGEMTFGLWDEQFPHQFNEAIDRLLLDARERIAAAARAKDRGGASAKPGGGGQRTFETQQEHAPSAANPEIRPGHRERDDPKAPARPAPSLTQQADRQSAAMGARMATVVKLSKLDTFPLINGQKLGDMTALAALAWAESRDRDVRFIRALTHGLPPDRPIREFVTGDEADKVYASVEARS
jgi:hypothetical protein